MERTECELRTRLTDGLCCDNADGLALLHHAARSQVATIALTADALLRLTGQHRTNLDALNLALLNLVGHGLGNLLASGNDDLARLGIDDIVYADTTQDALAET